MESGRFERADKKLAAQLVREYDHIYQTHKLALHFSPAVMVLSTAKGFLGRWDPGAREIAVSEKLCYNYDWGVVREVLRHEIAHQIVDEALGGEEGPSHHGPAFQNACEMIGVAPWARHPHVDLDARRPSLRELVGEESSPVEQRISKLLRLSQSDNVHEAQQALEKVQELREKYLICEDQEGSPSSDDIHVLTFFMGKKTRDVFHVLVAHILVKHFGVQTIFTMAYDVKKHCEQRALEVVGIARDLLMADYIYHYLLRTCHSLWQQHLCGGKQEKDPTFSPRRDRNSFYRGVLEGFDEALARRATARKRAGPEGSCSAVVSAADRALQKTVRQYYGRRYPSVSRSSFRTSSHRVASLKAGKELGKKLEVRAPLEQGKDKTPSTTPLLRSADV